MTDDQVSRRSVLRGVGVGVAATALAGQAAAADPEGADLVRYNVGLDRNSETDVVNRIAESVDRTIYLGDHGTVVSGTFPTAATEQLRTLPNVRFVEKDFTAYKVGERLPWGVDRGDAEALHEGGRTGDGATIAVLDTGVDDDHPDLADNVVNGRAFAAACGTKENDCGLFGGEGYNGNDCNYDWSDDDDHGSHVAGTANAVRGNGEGVAGGVSTGADILAGKVLNGCGSGSYSTIADGIRWATDAGADVINMSLGGSSGSDTLKAACQYAVDNGVVVVAAAGNDGACTDCVGYPAKYSTVIAVSATDENDDLANYSSQGPEVELAAPGTDVLSTIPPESDSGSTYADGYETFSGTSMASPHVAGAAGQVVAETSLSDNAKVRQRLKETAEDVGLADDESGAGLLDAEAAAGVTGEEAPAVSTGDATNVGSETATLSGTLSDLGTASSAEVFFEYGESGASLSATTSSKTLSATGSFSIDVSGLDPATEYQYRAVVEASDGDGDTGAAEQFTTTPSEGDDPPAVDALSVTDTSFWFFESYRVDWTVSDPNGDLTEVTVELLNGNGTVEERETVSVSGAEASDSTSVSPGFFSDGETVRLTVADDDGNTASGTRST